MNKNKHFVCVCKTIVMLPCLCVFYVKQIIRKSTIALIIFTLLFVIIIPETLSSTLKREQGR